MFNKFGTGCLFLASYDQKHRDFSEELTHEVPVDCFKWRKELRKCCEFAKMIGCNRSQVEAD